MTLQFVAYNDSMNFSKNCSESLLCIFFSDEDSESNVNHKAKGKTQDIFTFVYLYHQSKYSVDIWEILIANVGFMVLLFLIQI